MKATWNGVVVAESDDTVLMDGNHYFPESALKREFVTFSNHKTMCVLERRQGSRLMHPDCAWKPHPAPSGYPCPHWTIMWITFDKPCMATPSA